MKTRFRIAAAFAALVLAGAAHADPLILSASPVSLQGEDDTVERVGALRYLGGLRLRAPDPAFGGLSGLNIAADGASIRFITDTGYWVTAALRHEADGRLSGIGTAAMGRLLTPDGKPIAHKGEGDAESLTAIKGGYAVGFEQIPRIWLYSGGSNPFLSRPRVLAVPENLRGMHGNSGLESLAALKDGRLVVIAENFPRNTPLTYGWIRTGSQWQRFDYERTGLFLPTDAATLPDGDLLVLERRFTYVGGVASRLVRVPVSALKPGGLVRGRELARIEPPLTVENFEGIDARRDEAGRTLIYLVSDDNFNFLQSTLLLMFALDAP